MNDDQARNSFKDINFFFRTRIPIFFPVPIASVNKWYTELNNDDDDGDGGDDDVDDDDDGRLKQTNPFISTSLSQGH